MLMLHRYLDKNLHNNNNGSAVTHPFHHMGVQPNVVMPDLRKENKSSALADQVMHLYIKHNLHHATHKIQSVLPKYEHKSCEKVEHTLDF